MKWIAVYLAVGTLLTAAWNIQVQTACGRPMLFVGLVLSPVIMPVLAPFIIWDDIKPNCERMKLASRMSSRQQFPQENASE